MKKMNPISAHMAIHGRSGRKTEAPCVQCRMFWMKTPERQALDAIPDPNPVKITKDQSGAVTKMEYQAQPYASISPHLPEDEDE